MTADVLGELVGMSNRLGDPGNDYVILAEGNTSARIDETSFWITASGKGLRAATPEDFLRVRFDKSLELREAAGLSDDEVRRGLLEAKIDDASPTRPSTELAIHATCLQLPGVNFVGHTHPTPINAVTCSQGFEEVASARLFPDEIVLCGPASLVVPYVDPGMPLAREINTRLVEFVETRGERPKIILLQNHGLIALGATAAQVEHITAMAVKAARILLGTFALGGPRFLSSKDVDRIHTRPDEHYRQRVIGLV